MWPEEIGSDWTKPRGQQNTTQIAPHIFTIPGDSVQAQSIQREEPQQGET